MSASPAAARRIEPSPAWQEQFSLFKNALNGQNRGPFSQMREDAFARFSEVGFPSTKSEEWKYTNLASLAAAPFVPRPRDTAHKFSAVELSQQFGVSNLGGPVLVFVDGAYIGSAGEEQREIVAPLADAIAQRSAAAITEAFDCHLNRHVGSDANTFVSLNTAFLTDGAVVVVPEGKKVSDPIQLLFVITGEKQVATYPRVIVVAQAQSEVTVIETHAALDGGVYFSNPVTEISAGENSSVTHVALNLQSDAAYHVSTIGISQAQHSRVSTCGVFLGGALVRNNLQAVLHGDACETHLYGLSVLRDSQHVDNHTVLDHAAPHCQSNELYKGIYADRSHGVFSGTIVVRPGAQKTNAIQSNNSVLLSADAQIDSKPQLKIWADDVKCTHGATVGQLDENALFYLRSRGIEKQQAQSMLLRAFADDLLARIENETIREFIEEQLAAKLSGSLEGNASSLPASAA